ncbi:MAG: hypothetical protein Q4E67_03440, partial [Planctomycetia bacterium]|nr:hypothetical protein [Planctomycetia bacterium]
QYATSVASLQEENPFWSQLFLSQPASWVHYYNIIGISEKYSKDTSQTDGVVAVRNARLPWAQSEIFIHGEHTTIPSNPQAILEVVNILHARLSSF